MQENKVIVELSSSHELPIVNKQQTHQYSRKIHNKSKKQKTYNNYHIHSQNRNESERIKNEYLKLCKQIKFVYGVGIGKLSRLQNPEVEVDRINTNKNTNTQNKLIIRDNQTGKNILEKQFPRNATQASEVDNLINPHFQFFMNDFSQFQKLNEIDNKLNLNLGARVARRKRQSNNFIVKRLETEYLNVEKIKIEGKNKNRPPNKTKEIVENRSDSAITLKKKQSRPQSYQQTPNLRDSLKRGRDEVFPVIFSISKTANKKNITEVQESPERLNIQVSNLLTNSPALRSLKPRTIRSTSNNQKQVFSVKKAKPFNPPYQTYFYRDMLWKVNFTNETIIQVPLEYEHRLRVFVGKGNNGGLIRGLIKRRIWFAITQKLEDANFVWTQLKHIPYFNLQKTGNIALQKKLSLTKQNDNSNGDNFREFGLLTQKQNMAYNVYFSNNFNIEERSDERFMHRNKYFGSGLSKRQSGEDKNGHEIQQKSKQRSDQCVAIRTILKSVSEIKQQRMHNHLINNYIIGNKKALFKTMTLYYKKKDDYVFNYLPHTFHIEKGLEDQNYFKFLRYYNQRNKQSKANGGEEACPWIVKPGEYSNRGNGIKVCKGLDEIKSIIKTKERYLDGTQRTYIVQAYIEKPLLYNRRKFDLRHYMMITCVNGILKGYWYRDGYVRTSSSEYSLSTNEGRVHLTNDAVQKNMPDYGKYEKGNKISYDELHTYLMKLYGFKNYNFKEIILPKMKKITTDIIRACSGSIDPGLHSNNFQIFGLDFMIDADFNVWLIEVNTNPCLELSCPLLGSIIPKMVQNALQLTLDAAYPPPVRYNPKGVHYLKKLQQQNKFDLVYDSRIDGFYFESQNAIDARLLNEEQETYEDQGQQWNEDD